MKKVLLFLALFGSGLAILLYISARQRAAKQERIQQQPEGPAVVEDLPFTRIPEGGAQPQVEEGTDETQSTVAGTLSGSAEFTVFEEGARGHKLYDLELEQVTPLGDDLYDLAGITAHTFDPESETLQATLVAQRGRARIEWRDGKFAVGELEPVRLFDAVVTLHNGVPMAPLTLTLEDVEGDLMLDRFSSKGPVLVEGEGIRATSLGLVAEQREGRLRLLEEGFVALDLEDESHLELSSTGRGPIVMTRQSKTEAGEPLLLEVTDGSKVTLDGAEGFALESRTLEVHGLAHQVLVDGVERRVFSTQEVVASEDVRGSHASAEFRGGRAVALFDADGQVEHLSVAERPVLGGEVLAELEPDADPELLWLELSGVGPLVVDYRSEAQVADFDMPGPAVISARGTDLRLDAAGGVRGSLLSEGHARAELLGAVSGQINGMDFSGSEVLITGREDEEQRHQLWIETQQPAHTEGVDEQGRPFRLDTFGELRARVERAKLFVPKAVDAHLEVEDAGTWVLDVGELEDLDVEVGSFRAKGGIVATGPYGVTRAARGVGYSRRHLELFGAPATPEAEQVPARFDLADGALAEVDFGFLRAMRIVLREGFLHAEESVVMKLANADGDQLLDCDWAEVRLLGDPEVQPETAFEFEARDVRRGVMHNEDGETVVTSRFITGRGVVRRGALGDREGELQELTGWGGVTVAFTGESTLTGSGERFTWTPEDGGRLAARAGERVQARGSLQPGAASYLLSATWIEYSESGLEAFAPEITQDTSAGSGLEVTSDTGLQLKRAVAEWMSADESGVLLSGSAHFEGRTRDGADLELDASSMHVEQKPGEEASLETMQHLVAWDGFVLRLGDQIVSRGEILEASTETLRMEGRPASIEFGGFTLESENLEYDVKRVLVSTDQGRFIGAKGSEWEGWTATYESLQPFELGESTVMVMRNPVLVRDREVVRASWALVWVDRDEWVQRTASWLDGEGGELPEEGLVEAPGPQEQESQAPNLFGRINSREISKVVNEIYFEGNVEYLVDGNRIGKMSAGYVDLADGHGWFRDCELWLRTSVRGVPTRIAVRSAWLHHSADGTISADEARITDCELAEPDYYVRTKNLRIKPLDGDSAAVWDVLLRDNSLVMSNGAKLPLPRVHYKSDGKGLPTIGNLSFGDTARFGSFIQATVNVDVGESVTEAVSSTVGVEPEEVDGSWRFRASYYNLRGPLLGTGFELNAADRFWMRMYLDGVYDTGTDVGMVRSKTNDENELRWGWYTRGRYLMDRGEWVDFQVSAQSDPGVQSEFYEGTFLRYDRRDTFARWRKAEGANYFSANARIRANSFRNDVERLPDLGALHGRTPIGEMNGVPLLYTATADAAYLRRRQGDATVFSPFDPVFSDGLGSRDFFRADTRHRIEAPFSLETGGVRVTPYSSVNATAWSEGEDPDTSPSRGALIVGAEAQATYFRTWNHGVIHDVTPVVGVRGDLASFESDGQPVEVDELDTPLAGKYVDFGLRSRWHVPGVNRRLDIAARLTHGADVPTGVEDGWQPMSVLSEFLAVAWGVPFAVRHDARYDLDDGDTTLSYTGFSLLPWDSLGFEVAHHHGLDDQRNLLYDAMSIGAVWEASSKWQLEGRQSIARNGDSNLDSRALIRRIGHDMIFELEFSYRASEGRSSVTFNFRPELGWRQPTFGLINTLRSLRL